MIIEYTLKIARQIELEKNIHEKINIVKSICKQEIQGKFKKAELVLVIDFLHSKDVEHDVKILLVYFCAVASHVKRECFAISYTILHDVFMTPFCEEYNHYFDPYNAYLGSKICEELITWQEQEKKEPIVEYHFLFTKANLIWFLNYLTEAEKRNELIVCYKQMYDISEYLPPDLQSRIYHNYGHVMYTVFFINNAYTDYLRQADCLFEKAIELRTKSKPNQDELKAEVLSRVTYSAHLRKLRKLEEAEKVITRLLEKLENNRSQYHDIELYYYDYAQCLNSTINIQEEKFANKQQNRLPYYTEKFLLFLEETLNESSTIQSDAFRMLASNMMMRDVISYDDKKQMFEKLMPEYFWEAKKNQNLHNEETCRYRLLFKIVDMLYRFFEGSETQERFMLCVPTMERWYFEEYPELFHIGKYELLLVGRYALSTLETQQDKNDGLYYSIYFLALFPLAINKDSDLRLCYFLIVQNIIHECSTKRNEIANILYYLQKLPWYKQQFRLLKSYELDFLLKHFLELEIDAYENAVCEKDISSNVLSAWDNVTLNMTRVAKRMMWFYESPHTIHSWATALNEFVFIQKFKMELGGSVEYKNFEQNLHIGVKELTKKSNSKIPINLEFDAPINQFHLQEHRLFQNVLLDKQLQKQNDFTFFVESPYTIEPYVSIHQLTSVLKRNRVICINTLIKNTEKKFLYCQEKVKILSTIIQYKNGKIHIQSKTTCLKSEEYTLLYQAVYNLRVKNLATITKHFVQLFSNIKNKSNTNLIWIGTDFLKFFPIHILSYRKDSTWLDVWSSITFCPSLRESYLSIKGNINKDPYNKQSVPTLRCIGENDDGSLFGNIIFKQLANTENMPCVYSENFFNTSSTNEYEQYTPKVFSYYGHIVYGHPLDPRAGFVSNKEKSTLNNIVNKSTCFPNTKRVELWGCQSSMNTHFHSKELYQYEDFSGHFLDITEQVIGTLKKIPDITTALICEHFSLNEKCSPNIDTGILLKDAILWYRFVVKNVREKIEKSFHNWASEQNEQVRFNKQHAYLRKEITALLNQERKKFHLTLPNNFNMLDFTEEVVDKSILAGGELCYLGRKKKIEKVWSYSDSEEVIKNIFDELEDAKSWGGVIFVETAFSE